MPETPDFPALTASDGNEPPPEGARFSPAAERNRQPILDALRQVLPMQGHALEIASGTGQTRGLVRRRPAGLGLATQ
jgi:hypothetical protein